MKEAHFKNNPLKPISMPLGARALMAVCLAVYILLKFAPAMISGPSGGGLSAFVAVIMLISFAIYDGVNAFRTGLRLPSRSLNFRSIGDTYGANKIESLMVSGTNPNDSYLSWVGNWATRASDRFSHLPVPYQRIFEIALTAIAFGVVALAMILFIVFFGRAAGKPELSGALLSWFFATLLVIAYGYWGAMLANIFTAASWARKLSPGRVINVITFLLLLFALLGYLSQVFKIEPTRLPSLQPWGYITWIGSILIVVVIVLLTWLRSRSGSSDMTCTRIIYSESADVHPQTIVNAFENMLRQRKSGHYSKLVNGWGLNKFEELRGMPGGSFEGRVIGEYGAKLIQIGSSRTVRIFSTIIGYFGIGLGAAAYIVICKIAFNSSYTLWLACLILLLFGNILLLLSNIPLSETIWTSYLMGVKVNGTYQGRGTIMVAANSQNQQYGSFLCDYALDGGLAKAVSVSYLSAAMMKADATRILVTTIQDDSEAFAVQQSLNQQLVRASGDSSQAVLLEDKLKAIESN